MSKCLNFISHREFKNTNSAAIPSLTTYPDKRNNHLSEENHKVMYNIINNFVQGIRTIPEFKQNLLEEPDQPTDRFIYD